MSSPITNINEFPDPDLRPKVSPLSDVHWISVYHPDILTCPPSFASVLRIPKVFPCLSHFPWKSSALNPFSVALYIKSNPLA